MMTRAQILERAARPTPAVVGRHFTIHRVAGEAGRPPLVRIERRDGASWRVQTDQVPELVELLETALRV